MSGSSSSFFPVHFHVDVCTYKDRQFVWCTFFLHECEFYVLFSNFLFYLIVHLGDLCTPTSFFFDDCLVFPSVYSHRLFTHSLTDEHLFTLFPDCHRHKQILVCDSQPISTQGQFVSEEITVRGGIQVKGGTMCLPHLRTLMLNLYCTESPGKLPEIQVAGPDPWSF